MSISSCSRPAEPTYDLPKLLKSLEAEICRILDGVLELAAQSVKTPGQNGHPKCQMCKENSASAVKEYAHTAHGQRSHTSTRFQDFHSFT